MAAISSALTIILPLVEKLTADEITALAAALKAAALKREQDLAVDDADRREADKEFDDTFGLEERELGLPPEAAD